MKLINAKIENFKSLKKIDISLDSNKTLIIGKNNSGKSNFLECIGIMLKLGSTGYSLPGFNSELNQKSKYFDVEKAIKINLKFDITDSWHILPEEVTSYSYEEIGRKYLDLTFEKKINIDGLFYIGEINVRFPEYVKTSKYLYFNSIIVNTNRIFDGNINENNSNSIFSTMLANLFGSFIIQKKYEIFLFESELDNTFSEKFCKLLSTWFEKNIMLNSTFNEVKGVIFEYESFLKEDILKFIEKEKEYNFDILEKILKKIRVLIDDGNIQDISLKGMGIQSTFLINLILKCNSFFRVPPIICIDEVELHLHPQAQRRFNSILNQISFENQLIITTHSPIFVTETDIFKLILLKKSEYTSTFQIQNKENLNENTVKRELNEFNSEMFFANTVMLVEGLTEKLFFRHIANKFFDNKYNFDINNISIIPVGSKTNGKIYLQILNEFKIPYFFLVDKDGEKELKKLSEINKYQNNFHFLKNGELEDYYSEELIKKISNKDNIDEILKDSSNCKPNKKTISKVWNETICSNLHHFPNKRYNQLEESEKNILRKQISKWFDQKLNEMVTHEDFETEPRKKYNILKKIFGDIGKPRLVLTFLNKLNDEKYIDQELIDIIKKVIELSKK